ncbi:hypothetical protein EDB92DRAFT_565996 [Lactarius akahatsu]|uniref:F-box domain-containing protein n=1 Tax=Lactarius akahatsu TaxID=416441 RepID=A0AAD4LGD6_9AGAM|nr:hypothetical protein EDB92DRAFT_565996 [Lactarius akahatsu]
MEPKAHFLVQTPHSRHPLQYSMEESTVFPREWPVQIASGGELGAGRAHEELCNFSTIEVLPEDVLLEIFDFYKLASTTLSWGWHELAHVCQRWRCIVFASQCRLGLRLLCTYGTPVKKTLDCWLTLPIVVRYNGTAPSSPDDEESIVTALQHRDRICEIDLILQGPLSEKVYEIMQEPFPLLERVALRSCDSAVLVLPSTFLGGSTPHLRVLHLDSIAFPALPQLLSSACDLVDLQLQRVPSTGYILPEALVAGLSMATKLKTFHLHFASPTSHSSPRSTPPPSLGRAVPLYSDQFRFPRDVQLPRRPSLPNQCAFPRACAYRVLRPDQLRRPTARPVPRSLGSAEAPRTERNCYLTTTASPSPLLGREAHRARPSGSVCMSASGDQVSRYPR